VASAWLDTQEPLGLATATLRVPGVFSVDPVEFMNRFSANSGILCALLPQMIVGLGEKTNTEQLRVIVSYMRAIEEADELPEMTTPIKSDILDKLNIPLDPDIALKTLEQSTGIAGLADTLCLYSSDRLRERARHCDEYLSAQALLEQTASQVTAELVAQHGLISWGVSIKLARESRYIGTAEEKARAGLPHYAPDGSVLGDYRLAGTTADGRVLTYVTASDEAIKGSSIGPSTMSAHDRIGDTWYPSVDDALRGTRADSPGYLEVMGMIAQAVQNYADTDDGPAMAADFDDDVMNGDDYMRPVRGWTLANASVGLDEVSLLG
jgi:hypothetical protein